MEALSGAISGVAAESAVVSSAGSSVLAVEELRVSYGATEVVKGVSLGWRRGAVSSLIGPSGCGKTTLLRTLNRLIELTPSARVVGKVLLDGVDVATEPENEVRRRVGMVFQRPNPFPMSIFDNVAYALREQGSRRPRRKALAEPVEKALARAGLWNEVEDGLGRSAYRLSGGQQQRLCIARVLAAKPEVILMDEPCASLDPRSAAAIEEELRDLKRDLAIVIVTHNLAQARRIADRVGFFLDGELVELAPTAALFESPSDLRTADYVAGRFG